MAEESQGKTIKVIDLFDKSWNYTLLCGNNSKWLRSEGKTEEMGQFSPNNHEGNNED